jgi:hypothetical protein
MMKENARDTFTSPARNVMIANRLYIVEDPLVALEKALVPEATIRAQLAGNPPYFLDTLKRNKNENSQMILDACKGQRPMIVCSSKDVLTIEQQSRRATLPRAPSCCSLLPDPCILARQPSVIGLNHVSPLLQRDWLHIRLPCIGIQKRCSAGILV